MVGKQVPIEDVEDKMPYVPGNERLQKNSLDVNAKYSNGLTEFAMHNKYPFMQAKATSDSYIKMMKKRPFVMSKSSISGMGQYASTYTGDNFASAMSMEQSISDLYLSSAYGIPFHGADICGYNGPMKTFDETLCTRWYILAATYPLARYSTSRLQTAALAPYEFSADNKAIL